MQSRLNLHGPEHGNGLAIFLPIPLKKISCKESHQPNKTNKKIRFAWIGRLVDFKFYILKQVFTIINLI